MKGRKPSSPTPNARLDVDKWWIESFLRRLLVQPSALSLQSPARAFVYSTSSLKPKRFYQSCLWNSSILSYSLYFTTFQSLHSLQFPVPAEGHESLFILWPVISDQKTNKQWLLESKSEAFFKCWSCSACVNCSTLSFITSASNQAFLKLQRQTFRDLLVHCGAEWRETSPSTHPHCARKRNQR